MTLKVEKRFFQQPRFAYQKGSVCNIMFCGGNGCQLLWIISADKLHFVGFVIVQHMLSFPLQHTFPVSQTFLFKIALDRIFKKLLLLKYLDIFWVLLMHYNPMSFYIKLCVLPVAVFIKKLLLQVMLQKCYFNINCRKEIEKCFIINKYCKI